SLKGLDYPNVEVVAIDDNTDDEELWRPVADWCMANGVTFMHLEDWPGYKSGALNYALHHLTDPRTELVGVVDSDYQIEPQSLRLLRAGWSGLHVDASFGHGVMPLTFEALKSQRYRWCFGGIQILRMHVRSLLPGRGDAANRMTLAQRWAYLCGALQWYGDL